MGEFGDKDEFIKRLKNGDIDVKTRYLWGWYTYTLLHKACLNNNLEAVKILIDNGADVNAKILADKGADGVGKTPLHTIAMHGCKDDKEANDAFEIAKLLVDKGADVKAKVDGQTLMQIACAHDNKKMFSLFSK